MYLSPNQQDHSNQIDSYHSLGQKDRKWNKSIIVYIDVMEKVNDNIIVYIDAMAKTIRARRRRTDIFTKDDSLN